MRRWFRSLQSKYMLIIILALFIVQFSYLFMSIMMSIGLDLYEDYDRSGEPGIPSARTLEIEWHKAAGQLTEVSVQTVEELFAEWKEMYPGAAMFWVDGRGRLAAQLDVTSQLPAQWTPVSTAQFIKSRYGGDPFTVIAFVGDGADGFIVYEAPREMFDPPINRVYSIYGFWLLIALLVIIVVFVLISYLFFRGIRKRLLQLQEAMSIRDIDGLPVQIDVRKNDEIGQLEQSFNQMVVELKESKQREQKEEQLRRELIANLSHDLRTPLTKIRAQAYTIGKQFLDTEGRQAIEAMERSIVNMDRLIDNLMAYTLLMANKYRLDARPMDILRFVKEHLVTWYPLFEKEGFEVEVDLEKIGHSTWTIDPLWMGRVLDNLYQNVLRHAKQGRYIKVFSESTQSYDAIVVEDRGGGMGAGSYGGQCEQGYQGYQGERGHQEHQGHLDQQGHPVHQDHEDYQGHNDYQDNQDYQINQDEQGSDHFDRQDDNKTGGLDSTRSFSGEVRMKAPGNNRSDDKGAGIGLSIVDRMLKGMQLDWEIETGPGGTTIKIMRSRN